MKMPVLLSFLMLGLVAQAGTPEQFLKTAWQDPRLAAHDESVALVTDAQTYNPLNKADLRLDRGEISKEDVKIGFRMYPKGYSEHVATSSYQRSMQRTEETARLEALSKILVSRYSLIALVALLREKKEISSQLSAVGRKAGRALSYASQKNRTEIKSYLKNRADLGKIEIKTADVERDYSNLQNEWKEVSSDSLENLDLSDLADMSDLRKKVEMLKDPGGERTLSGRVFEMDLQKNQAGLDLDQAQKSKWLEHIEVSVKDDKKEKVYGVEVAINLPFFSTPDLSRIDKEAKQRRERAQVADMLQVSQRGLKNTFAELKTLLALHQSMQEGQARMSPEQMRKASNAIAAQDPMLALELQRSWFESREAILDLEFRIRILFLNYLHETSAIASSPEANVFSKSGRKIL